MTLLFANTRFAKVYADIRRGSPERVSTTAILSIFTGYFSETLEIRPALLFSDMESLFSDAKIHNLE